MAKVIEKRPDGSTVIVVPASEAAELEVGGEVDVRPASKANGDSQPWPFGAWAGKYPPFEVEEVKAARRDALRGKTE